MPTLTEKITIASPLAEVWPLLSDPETVASCIPGATLSPDREDNLWKGTISVKFGPTSAVFRGEAELTYDHDAYTCTIEGRGIDQRGASRALANGNVAAAAIDNTTELTVEGDYTVSGPLETFANAGGVHVARALLAEFATNLSKLTGEPSIVVESSVDETALSKHDGPIDSPTSPATHKPTSTAAKELNAFALLWAAFKSWASSLFGKRN